jgi:hypothetical protein
LRKVFLTPTPEIQTTKFWWFWVGKSWGNWPIRSFNLRLKGQYSFVSVLYIDSIINDLSKIYFFSLLTFNNWLDDQENNLESRIT